MTGNEILTAAEDVLAGLRFALSLPLFLRRTITLEQARAMLVQRRTNRSADFLRLAQRTIYGHAASPYRQLLLSAGCEPGDLTRLVQREGLEGALATLFRQGVYLTVDEMKGRRPVLRGSLSFQTGPRDIRNPLAAMHLHRSSGGTSGPATPRRSHLAFVRDRAVTRMLTMEAHGGGDWPVARWGVPGAVMLVNTLQLLCMGRSFTRNFMTVDPMSASIHARYRWSLRALQLGTRLAGRPDSGYEVVPRDQPLPIVYWLQDVLRSGQTPLLTTSPSAAVRVCASATAAGIELHGARFHVHGEPLTATRRATIEAAGVGVLTGYTSSETGHVGFCCETPARTDDLHYYDDLLALIQPGDQLPRPNEALPATALLATSLRSTAPLILLNTSLGDQANLTQRDCGCGLQKLGWHGHLDTIRSFEKLTAGGMTFHDTDIVRVLEEVLPARFGGTASHYQLFDDVLANGQPCLRLLIDPLVGPLDERAAIDLFLVSLGRGSGVERLMSMVWRDEGFLTVERRRPVAGGTGQGSAHRRRLDLPLAATSGLAR